MLSPSARQAVLPTRGLRLGYSRFANELPYHHPVSQTRSAIDPKLVQDVRSIGPAQTICFLTVYQCA
jgi:hypothetical protein